MIGEDKTHAMAEPAAADAGRLWRVAIDLAVFIALIVALRVVIAFTGVDPSLWADRVHARP
jgi:hypothetical protein